MRDMKYGESDDLRAALCALRVINVDVFPQFATQEKTMWTGHQALVGLETLDIENS